MEQRFLDLMARIEQSQVKVIAELTARIAATERENQDLLRRLTAMEMANIRQARALQRLNATLGHLMDPPVWPPSSDSSSGD